MRISILAWLMATTIAAGAQDGAQTITIAEVRTHKAEMAGMFIRIENVTISGFSQRNGGLASDATGGARIDDIGMPPRTITHLERHCGQARPAQSPALCRGTLEFTLAGHETARSGFTISDAEFIPQN